MVSRQAVVLGAKYLIGNDANSGAWEIGHELSTLDLRQDCFDGKICPPVVIFTGQQSGSVPLNRACIIGI